MPNNLLAAALQSFFGPPQKSPSTEVETSRTTHSRGQGIGRISFHSELCGIGWQKEKPATTLTAYFRENCLRNV